MHFQVLTTREADNDLIALWVAATPEQRKQITEASAFFDKFLQQDPNLKGFSYDPADPGVRYLVRDPLAVYFRVSEPDLRVTIFRFEWADLV